MSTKPSLLSRPSRWSGACLALAAALVLLTTGAARSAAPRALPRSTAQFHLTDLGLPGSATGSYSTAVNASAEVVGYWKEQGAGSPHAFFWDAAHGMANLPELPGDVASVALDLNDAGQAVGISVSPEGGSHAVRWDADRSVHDLGNLGGDPSSYRHRATGINSATAAHGAQITGVSYSTTYQAYRPFIWDAEHGMQDIGPTVAVSTLPSQAWSISDAGQITSAVPVGGQNHIFRWTPGRGLNLLDPGGSPATVGYSINANGRIVGSGYLPTSGVKSVTLWGPRDGMFFGWPLLLQDDLPDLVRPAGINTTGEFAFTSSTDGGGAQPFLFWESRFTNLNSITTLNPGDVLKSAVDVNDHRQVVGDFYAGADGRRHAYLATPEVSTSADLEVSQTAWNSSIQAGGQTSFKLTVKNRGMDATVATLTDTLSPSATFLSSTVPGTQSGGELVLNLGTLAGGTERTVWVDVRAGDAGTLTSTATVSGTTPDPNAANDTVSTSVTVTPAPPPAEADLAVSMTASPLTVQSGKSVRLTAAVSNHGTSAARDVLLYPVFDGVAQSPLVIGTVGVHQSVTRQLSFTPAASGTVTLTATAKARGEDSNPADDTASATLTVEGALPIPQPDLSGEWGPVRLVRSGPAKQPVYTLTGTLTVRNGGAAPAPATVAAFTASTDGTPDTGDLVLQTAPDKPVTLKIPALRAGAGKAFRFSFKLPAGMSPSGLTGLNVIATIDPDSRVSETDETNNLAVGGPIQ